MSNALHRDLPEGSTVLLLEDALPAGRRAPKYRTATIDGGPGARAALPGTDLFVTFTTGSQARVSGQHVEALLTRAPLPRRY